MTEDTQKYLKHLPDLRFETQQTDAKGLGIITTYYAFKKRTVVRPHKDNIENIGDMENDEEEKDDHESELFQDSDDSRVKRIDNVEEHKNPEANNSLVKVGEAGQEPSMYVDEASENGHDNQNDKSKNVIFEVPKYLICIKRKNAKYESYIFKKNVENYKFFFNFSCCLLVLMMGLSEIYIFGDDENSEMNTEKTVYLI